MGRPPLRIVEPRWTYPAWAVGSRLFSAIVAGLGEETPSVRLISPSGILPVNVVGHETVAHGHLERLTCALVDQDLTPTALYALEVETSSDSTVAPNSVCVLDAYPETYTFVHTTDLHLAAPKNGQLTDRRPLAEEMVARINALAPAFVLNTGDVISRYGVDTVKLDDALIRWQAREARRILLGLSVPMFVIPGNHDRAFAASRSAWHRYMASPGAQATDDQVFDWGNGRFVGLDGSHLCDEVTHEKLDPKRSVEQLSWLSRVLSEAPARGPRVVYTHWDYAGDITAVLRSAGCDLLLLGHTALPPDGDFPWQLGHLSGQEAYRVWHVAGGDVSPGRVVRYDELGTAPVLDASLLEPGREPRY